MIFFKVVEPARRRPRPRKQDEDEDIEVHTFSLVEARDMIRRGEIRDMKTIVGLRLISGRFSIPKRAGVVQTFRSA